MLGMKGEVNMEWVDKMNAALDYIEDNLTENIDFEEANCTILCKKIYYQDLDLSQIPEDAVQKYYLEELCEDSFKDIDIATNATPVDIKNIFTNFFIINISFLFIFFNFLLCNLITVIVTDINITDVILFVNRKIEIIPTFLAVLVCCHTILTFAIKHHGMAFDNSIKVFSGFFINEC